MNTDLLATFYDPYLKKAWGDVPGVKYGEKGDTISVSLPYLYQSVEADLKQALTVHCGEGKTIHFKLDIKPHKTQPNVEPIKQVKNVIAVASGKGGVGKSTTALNLALALKAQGATVGLLDADIHGPNQPGMLAHDGNKPEIENEKFKPIERFGLHTMSLGYLVDTLQPVIWRGPMASGALAQMVNDTLWPTLDYLVIDMPPGTGDIQMTLAQKVPVSGAVIVTTPQNVALQDARKGLAMFQKVSIPVMGVVENMAYYHCPACGHADDIFGRDGGERLAEQFGMPLLGKIPLNSDIRRLSDEGRPAALFGDEVIQKAYHDAAFQLSVNLSLQARSYADKFLNIKVEHDKEA